MGLKLGQYIKSIRKEKKVPVRVLSEKTDISKSYIDYIENGMREPSPEILAKIAVALDLPLDALLSIQKSEQLEKTIVRLKVDSANYDGEVFEVRAVERDRTGQGNIDDEALKKVQKAFEETANAKTLAEYIENPEIRAIFRACNELSDEELTKLRKVMESLYPDAFTK